VILRSRGPKPTVEVDILSEPFPLLLGDRWVLGSDGLTHEFSYYIFQPKGPVHAEPVQWVRVEGSLSDAIGLKGLGGFKSRSQALLCSGFFLAACQPNPCAEDFVRLENGQCVPEVSASDTGDLPLPEPTQELWVWDVEGEAEIQGLEGSNATWAGRSTWTYTQVESESILCVFELETNAFGLDFNCKEDPDCDWGFWVQHGAGVELSGDCLGHVGLEPGVPVVNWALGFGQNGALLYFNSPDSGQDPEQWVPIGTASFDGGQFRYELDQMAFYVFED
jgi:hypothetical protein